MYKANIIIITQGVSRIVEPLLKEANVVGIIQTSSKKNKAKTNSFVNQIRRFISIFFKKYSSLKDFSNRNNIPFYFMDKGSNYDLENWVKDKTPDLIVIYMMSELLKSNNYNFSKYKTINLHPSLLPNYRGPNPWFWMYFNKDKKGGVTLHFIDDGEDTGDIIYQEEYQIPLGIKSPDLNDIVIGEIGVKLILKGLKNFKNLPRLEQIKESSTIRARNIKLKEHSELVDWENWDVEKIWHLLRGTELWLNAIELPKGIYKGQRWIIKDYMKCETKGYCLSKVYKENGKNFTVCKDGFIYISLKFSFKNMILNFVR